MLTQQELGKSGKYQMLPGTSFPLGSRVVAGGVNFSLYSMHATAVELLLFAGADDAQPVQTFVLDATANKTYDFWHAFIPGLGTGQVYAFRVHGPFAPEVGLRFDSKKVLLDPYAKAIVGWNNYDRTAAATTGDNCAKALRSVVIDGSQYDWEGDRPLRIACADSVIYEMHVGGFTRNHNSGVKAEHRGTFAGIIEKIPYLKELGITAVELMPVHQFDETDAPNLENYWGYSTTGFFAPHHGFCIGRDPVRGVTEFKDMVKALHKAGIEVILDVVFNHTSEGGDRGPTQCFKGLDNPIYYVLEKDDRSQYANYTGCGNVFSANHPVVGRVIIDSLRYWVSEMHVDGFRFDLAAALARDVWGDPMPRPPLLWVLESDPVLAGTKLIAEAWDAAGLYKVGWFVTASQWYAEWNGPFRDDVRKYVKGDQSSVGALAARMLASSDIYTKQDRETNRSINFVTCHDGFTLNDLVSYNHKHNDANAENNRDGSDANFSWNCGTEGATNDEQVRLLRQRQMKNLLTILFASQGTPMILMGDEVARTQQGNNNAYCQNSELSWFDWDDVNRHSGMLRFARELIKFTQSLDLFQQTRPVAESASRDRPYFSFHGTKLNSPDWGGDSHALALNLKDPTAGEELHIMLNAYWEPLEFQLPELDAPRTWTRIVDTSLQSPQDISDRNSAPQVKGTSYKLAARSAVILMAR